MSGMGLVGAAPKPPPPPPPKSSPTPKSTPATPPKVSDLVVLDDDVPSPAPTLKDLEETQVQEHPAVPSATEPGVKKVDSTPTEVPKDCNALGGQPTSGESTTVSTKSVGPTGNDGQDPVETPTPTQKTVVPPEPTEVIAQASVESPTPKTVGPSEPNNVMGQNGQGSVGTPTPKPSDVVTPPAGCMEDPAKKKARESREENLRAELDTFDDLKLKKLVDDVRGHPLLGKYYKEVFEVSMEDALFGEDDAVEELISFDSFLYDCEHPDGIITPVPVPPAAATAEAAVAKAPVPKAPAALTPPVQQPPVRIPQKEKKVTFQPNPPQNVPPKNSGSHALDVRVVGTVLQLHYLYILHL